MSANQPFHELFGSTGKHSGSIRNQIRRVRSRYQDGKDSSCFPQRRYHYGILKERKRYIRFINSSCASCAYVIPSRSVEKGHRQHCIAVSSSSMVKRSTKAALKHERSMSGLSKTVCWPHNIVSCKCKEVPPQPQFCCGAWIVQVHEKDTTVAGWSFVL